MQQMITPLAAQGVDFIGLNPLHALYPELPQDCSPYSPNSRLWLNTEYVALEHTAEFADCTAAQQLVNSESFQQRLQHLREKLLLCWSRRVEKINSENVFSFDFEPKQRQK